jgi:predicted PurR-regulated permease PerM
MKNFNLLDIFFLFLVVILSAAFFQVLRPFFIDIFLAVLLVRVFWPVYKILMKKTKGNKILSSLLILFLTIITIVGPILWIVITISFELVGGVSSVISIIPQISTGLTEFLESLETISWLQPVSEYLNPREIIQNLSQAVTNGINLLLQVTQQSFVNITTAVAHFVLILMLQFFLTLDGEVLIEKVKEIIPLSRENTDKLSKSAMDITSATLISTLTIGVIEGSYGAILFLTFGLPSPVLWGVIMFIVSMLPLLGANAIIFPAGIILILSGRIVSGVLLMLAGFVGLTITQNVVKPKLLGDRSGLHPAIVLLSTIGGIIWLGLIGFIVGPLIAALFILIWNLFALRYREVLDERDPIPVTQPIKVEPGQASPDSPEDSQDSDEESSEPESEDQTEASPS